MNSAIFEVRLRITGEKAVLIEKNRLPHDYTYSGGKCKEYNLGICLLKMVMAYTVICCHFLGTDLNDNILIRVHLSCAVPTFMIISFYYFGKKLHINDNMCQLVRRCKRIFVPQVVWTLIYAISFKLLYEIFHVGQDINIIDVFWQAFLGHSVKLNPAMWFQFDLMVLTVLLAVLVKICREKYQLMVLAFLLVISYFLQYSGINSSFWKNTIYEIRYPMGRIIEVVPAAVIGVIFARIEVLERLKKKGILVGISFMFVSIVMAGAEENYISDYGFGYVGLHKLIYSIGVIFITFNILSADHLEIKVKNTILFVSKFTMGIYFIHILIGKVVFKMIEILKIDVNRFVLCFIIYITSYVVCFGFSRTNNKLIKMLVQ